MNISFYAQWKARLFNIPGMVSDFTWGLPIVHNTSARSGGADHAGRAATAQAWDCTVAFPCRDDKSKFFPTYIQCAVHAETEFDF